MNETLLNHGTSYELQDEEGSHIHTPSRTSRFGAYLRSRSRKTWIITGVAVALVVLVALVVVIGVTVGTAVGVTESEDAQQRRSFNDWMTQWNMTYSAAEYEMRLANFKQTLQLIQQHSSTSYQVGLNKFAAMTAEEKNAYRGAKIPFHFHHNHSHPSGPPSNIPHRRSAFSNGKRYDVVNWVSAGKVAPVEDQGNCGDCWAFSAAGAMTSSAAIAAGSAPYQLSEQYLIDCSGSACGGGWPASAFQYVQSHGIPVSGEYSSYVQAPQSCSLGYACGLPGSVTVTNYGYTSSGDENSLLNQLYYGPVSVAIDASSSFMSYAGGVFNGPCSDQINHAVLVVGAGVDDATGQAYWLVKNSWGTWWGENGYVRIARNAGNMCSIASYGMWVQAQFC
jgi:hypothetical protein